MWTRGRILYRVLGTMIVCLMVLTQSGCATVQFSPAAAPGSGGTDPPGSADGGSNRSSPASTVGVVIVSVVGGYLLYKLFFDNSDEATTNPEPGPSGQGPIEGLVP